MVPCDGGVLCYDGSCLIIIVLKNSKYLVKGQNKFVQILSIDCRVADGLKSIQSSPFGITLRIELFWKNFEILSAI